MNNNIDKKKKHAICMVSDFFYPNMGGVEGHIFQLSQCLLELGHKVIVVTHFYGKRKGVRYMTNGLKVYYLPIVPFYNQCIFPCMYVTCGLIRDVLIREQITIVHGHSAFSTLAHETLFHAKILNLKAVFTDHSLFGFADASSILTNKILECSIANCDHAICVSNTCRENTTLRANVEDPSLVSVIPNAIDSSMFRPDLNNSKHNNRIIIVVVSRLVYRKGTDLLIGIIPEICKKYSNVDFLIAGDGPKRISIEEVREKYKLHPRVKLLGSVKNHNVRNVLVKGNIFLNTSLTEAFCIAILEAASCGLQVVSTKVGGIPEVLPDSMITLCEPNVSDLLHKLELTIEKIRTGNHPDALEMHENIKSWYSWRDVARRTEKVYDLVASNNSSQNLMDKARKFNRCGYVGYYMMALIYIVDFLVLSFFELINPADKIDKVPDLYGVYKKNLN